MDSLADSTTIGTLGVKGDIYTCRLCGRPFHDIGDLIGIHSDEGRRLQIAQKIFYTLSIMITENDPTSKYVCKVCNGHLECNFKFSYSCRSKNYDIVKNAIKLPHNNIYCDDLKKMLKIPFQSLYFKPTVSIKDGYETVTNYMKNPKADLNSFIDEMKLKVMNEFEKNKPTNGYIQIPTPAQLNMSLNNKLTFGNRSLNGNTGTNSMPGSSNIIPRITIVNRNQIIQNGPTISNNTNNGHNSNNALTRVNGNGTNASEDDEVICVDDDENDQQVAETNVNPINKWICNNIKKVIKEKVSKNQANETLQKILQTKRKLINVNPQSINQNRSSNRTTNQHSSVSNVVSEDMTITPDIPMLNIDVVSPFNESENDYNEDPPHTISDPPLVTPETGIHFLFAPRETVDLTTTESPKKKPIRKRKSKSDVKKSPPKKIYQKTPIASENEEERNQSPSQSSSEAVIKPSTTLAKKRMYQKTPIDSENEGEKNQSPPLSPSEAIIIPSTTLAKKKMYHKTPIASENEEERSQSPPQASSEAVIKLSTTLIKKKIYQKTFLKPENEKEKNKLLSVSSTEVVMKYPRAAKKSVLPAPKRFSRRLLLTQPPKPKPKRKSAPSNTINITTTITTTNELNQYSHLLGEKTDGFWDVKIYRIELPKYKCPICDLYFHSIRSRQNHETLSHFLPLEFPLPSVESVQELENTSSIEQQEFLLYLNLVKKIPLKQKTLDILASRPNVLKSLRIVGNTIGSYDCHYCEYKTTRLFILWAHITSCHNKPRFEKKSIAYCFLCNRYIGKRVKLLKHIDLCTNRLAREAHFAPPPVKHFTCDVCHDNFNSSSDLEKHFYNHVAIARQNIKKN